LVLDRLHMAVDRSERHGTWTTVVFADLDGFKTVNDTLGHTIGDEVLAAVARRLRAAVRAEDTCGRWGGDEFVMVLELEEPETINDIVGRLQLALEDPVPAGDRTVTLGLSIGVAMARSGDSPERLLELADDAMYRAKRMGHPVQFTTRADGQAVVTEM
jgi:diguanylate cyclase (GGDEF)-like protein